MAASKRLLTRSDIETVKRIITYHKNIAFCNSLTPEGASMKERHTRWLGTLQKTLKAATLANSVDGDEGDVVNRVASTDGLVPDDGNPLNQGGLMNINNKLTAEDITNLENTVRLLEVRRDYFKSTTLKRGTVKRLEACVATVRKVLDATPCEYKCQGVMTRFEVE